MISFLNTVERQQPGCVASDAARRRKLIRIEWPDVKLAIPLHNSFVDEIEWMIYYPVGILWYPERKDTPPRERKIHKLESFACNRVDDLAVLHGTTEVKHRLTLVDCHAMDCGFKIEHKFVCCLDRPAILRSFEMNSFATGDFASNPY